MVGLQKEKRGFSAQTVTVEYSGFSLSEKKKSGLLSATESVNCDCKDGILSTGYGFTELYMNNGNVLVAQLEVKKVHRLFFFEVVNEGEEDVEVGAMAFDSANFYLHLKTANVFTALGFTGKGARQLRWRENDGTLRNFLVSDAWIKEYVGGTTVVDSLTITGVRGACICKDRTFLAVAPCYVYYSAPLSPLDFTDTIDDSGKISLPCNKGNIKGIKALGEWVYVFFERGIIRLSLVGAAREFKAERVFYGGGNIFADSVGESDKFIFFLAEDGVYRLSGKKAEKVFEDAPIFPKRQGQVCDYACFDGKYTVQYLDGTDTRKRLVGYENGKDWYFATPLYALTEWRGNGYCIADSRIKSFDKNGALLKGESYSFTVRGTTFGERGRKTLKQLRLEGEGSFSLRVKADGREKSVAVSLDGGAAVVDVGIFGEEFDLEFDLQTGCRIRSMTATLVKLKAA